MSHTNHPQSTPRVSGPIELVCLLSHFSGIFPLHQLSVASRHVIFLDRSVAFRYDFRHHDERRWQQSP
jgi:hypothetical protein